MHKWKSTSVSVYGRDPARIKKRWRELAADRRNRKRLVWWGKLVRSYEAEVDYNHNEYNLKPVIFFNASARLSGFSQNAAFSLLTSWAVRLAGAPVIHFVCKAGLSPCVQGTNRQDYSARPPCKACQGLSGDVYAGAQVRYFEYLPDSKLERSLSSLSVEELGRLVYTVSDQKLPPIPLGSLVMPAVRWALRRHTLPDTPENRYLLRQYILSAFSLVFQFDRLLADLKPQAAVIFNGIMYPEASARWVARQRGVRVITHEVGFQHFSAFFTEGDATAYPIQIPEDFNLSPEQDADLDKYLEQRFKGNFTMAGIQFWPEMIGLDEAFLNKASNFRQVVPIFSNVVYDTSQVHANTVFPHMFAWLNLILEVIRTHPETFFVIRAHPDEMRPGTRKQSRESVRDWFFRNGLAQTANVVLIDSQEYINSYELIQRAKFVVVYNSSVGLEAALMGAPVLCGGKARYTQVPMVIFPGTQEGFKAQMEDFLEAGEIHTPVGYRLNARQFLYYQFYKVSLSFEAFLQDASRAGFVYLKGGDLRKSWKSSSKREEAINLLRESPILQVLVDGILDGKAFLAPVEQPPDGGQPTHTDRSWMSTSIGRVLPKELDI